MMFRSQFATRAIAENNMWRTKASLDWKLF
ncbi:hypothetical protein BCO37747_05362 [Burkholderia contaminans]|nr:hypothetical protein SK875_A00671 [Burkholderia contaminans]VWC40911.1 hypothetical protein BCO23253_07097 [Burkholderia contaminans]VWD40806.1 hypothetical protein BCO37747_05362 [Burkholderia contaminans]